MKKIINPTIVHSATQPTEKADLWIKALPNNQNTLMIFDNGYENVDSNLTERLDNEAQERSDADEELNTTLTNKINQENADRVSADNNLSDRINTNLNSINTINSKIPSQASSTNQLADKDFVNSSIANDAATFQGTFETVNDLPTTNVKKNDYAFIVSVTSEGNPEYKRYKYNGTQWIEEFTLNNSSFTANQWAAINSGITDTWINDTNEKLEKAASSTNSIIEITWSDLKAKRDAGELTPSQLYRIIDYQCTTIESDTQSAGHQFDIIVLALSKNTLSEQAYAALHSGDTYFANNNLSAWKLWYCLDNDTTRFAWADSTNGKGVIYRMVDEFNNDVPYDFKNIQFNHPTNTSTYRYYYYTFASDNVENNTDYSLSISNKVYSNEILPYINDGKQQINKNLFLRNYCHNNIFRNDCYNNTFNGGFYANTFGVNCYGNTFGGNCYCNIFRNNFQINTFGDNCYYNTFENGCHNFIFGNHCYSNTFGHNCTGTFGTNCFSNIFGNDCNNNFGDFICLNIFGNNCYNIYFAKNVTTLEKANYYRFNKIDSGVQDVVLYNADTASNFVQKYHIINRGTTSDHVTIQATRNLAYETKVAMNSAGELKIYCEADLVQ